MDDYVESVKKGLKESRHYFGNAKKQERELWVLREFLSYLPIAINDAGITASAQEPHDVFYEQHGFQVKEVLSEGRLRGKEYADKVNAISEETKPDELFEPYTPIHVPLHIDTRAVPSPHAPFGRSPLYFLRLMIAHELLPVRQISYAWI